MVGPRAAEFKIAEVVQTPWQCYCSFGLSHLNPHQPFNTDTDTATQWSRVRAFPVVDMLLNTLQTYKGQYSTWHHEIFISPVDLTTLKGTNLGGASTSC